MESHTITSRGNGHGQGSGISMVMVWRISCINMAGTRRLESIAQLWKKRNDFTLPFAGAYSRLRLNEDSRQDLIWGNGHDYGLYCYGSWNPKRMALPAGSITTLTTPLASCTPLPWRIRQDGKQEIITWRYMHTVVATGAEDLFY